MFDILFFLIAGTIMYAFWRISKGQKILPAFITGKKEEEGIKASNKLGKISKETIRYLLGIEDIKYHMIWMPDNWFVMAIKCAPVNYDLRNKLEQEAIDIKFEQWLVALDFDTVVHIQNRFVELHDQTETYLNSIEGDPTLNEYARNYCIYAIEYMQQWLRYIPRFEKHRYVLVPYQVRGAGTRDEVINKAIRELYRRANSIVNHLKGAEIKGKICSTADLAEMVYYSLNRKRAQHEHFSDIQLHETLSLYCTAEQDEIRVKKVLEENVQDSEEEKTEAV